MGHPLGKGEEIVAENGLVIEDGFEESDFEIGRSCNVDDGDDSDELLVVERGDDAGATLGMLAFWDCVSECAIKRDGQRDFAVGRHGTTLSVMRWPLRDGEDIGHLKNGERTIFRRSSQCTFRKMNRGEILMQCD